MGVLNELMKIRSGPKPTETMTITGADPVLPSRYPLGSFAADIMLAIGIAANDIWAARGHSRQSLRVDRNHAGAALRSYQYLRADDTGALASFTAQRDRQRISTPHPTRDGRYFLPHMGLPHLAERILAILKCDYELESVVSAVARWNAQDLEDAVANARGCGAMIRSSDEWLAHPQGRALAGRGVVTVEKIGDSDPMPFPASGEQPLSGIRVLDLTRILAGPTCARTLAEQGADVLMVTAADLPQSELFVMDTSHGKKTCYLDLKSEAGRARLMSLVGQADVFSQGYRPGAMARLSLAPGDLARMRPGIIYTSMNCYGYDGPFGERAGWEQLAQSVTGLAAEHGGERPTLLPAAACDYSTGYLAAFGTLLALARRATEGGSYHVRASLCQSGMLLQRQGRVDWEGQEIEPSGVDEIMMTSETPHGRLTHLGPFLGMSETPPRWRFASSPLGTHDAAWW